MAFVKTSTGYGFVKQSDGSYNYKGATVPHLRLMRANIKPHVQVKAAGGVRTLDDLLMVRALGVTRIGATATAVMLDEAAKRRRGKPAPAGSGRRRRHFRRLVLKDGDKQFLTVAATDAMLFPCQFPLKNSLTRHSPCPAPSAPVWRELSCRVWNLLRKMLNKPGTPRLAIAWTEFVKESPMADRLMRCFVTSGHATHGEAGHHRLGSRG